MEEFTQIVTAEEYDRLWKFIAEEQYRKSLQLCRERDAAAYERDQARQDAAALRRADEALDLAVRRKQQCRNPYEEAEAQAYHNCTSCGIYMSHPAGDYPRCEVCSGTRVRLIKGSSRENGEAADRQYHGSRFHAGEW